MNFTVVTMYTKNTPYEDEVEPWVEAANKMSIQHKIYDEEPRGSWERNCKIKTDVILDSLETTEKNVLWVDIDARIYNDLSYFNSIESDIAAYILFAGTKKAHLCSGTVFFKNNLAAKKVVQYWQLANHNRISDQRNLHRSVKHCVWEEFPPDYCKIFDLPAHKNVDGKIVHYQASRRYKRKV